MGARLAKGRMGISHLVTYEERAERRAARSLNEPVKSQGERSGEFATNGCTFFESQAFVFKLGIVFKANLPNFSEASVSVR